MHTQQTEQHFDKTIKHTHTCALTDTNLPDVTKVRRLSVGGDPPLVAMLLILALRRRGAMADLTGALGGGMMDVGPPTESSSSISP